MHPSKTFHPAKRSGADSAGQPPKLLDGLRNVLCTKHYSYRRRAGAGPRGEAIPIVPPEATSARNGGLKSRSFLSYLAVTRHVLASTQTQALCALSFLYKQVLKIELPNLDAVRAKRPKRLPTVLSQYEVARLIECVTGGHGGYRLRNLV